MSRLVLVFLCSLLWSLAALAGVNINTASQSELESLPGIGPSKAAAILQHRSDFGPFQTVEQLDDVPGIGPATLESLRPFVSLGPVDPNAEVIVRSPGPRLEDADDDTAPAFAGGLININTASGAQLEELPGIGPAKAAAILDHRDSFGAFEACDQLLDVSGIGPATLAGLRDRCTVE